MKYLIVVAHPDDEVLVAKDPQAALRIREILTQDVPNPRARFVEMALSGTGFQVSRS